MRLPVSGRGRGHVNHGAALGHFGQHTFGQHAKTAPIDRHDLVWREATPIRKARAVDEGIDAPRQAVDQVGHRTGIAKVCLIARMRARCEGSEVDCMHNGSGRVQQVEGCRSDAARRPGNRDGLAFETEQVVHPALLHTTPRDRWGRHARTCWCAVIVVDGR